MIKKIPFLFFVLLFFVLPFDGYASTDFYDNTSCGLGADFILSSPKAIQWKPYSDYSLDTFSLFVHMGGTSPVQDFYYMSVKIYRASTTTDPVTDGIKVAEANQFVDIPVGEANKTEAIFSLWDIDDVILKENEYYVFIIETTLPYSGDNYIVMNGDSTGCVGYEDTTVGTLYKDAEPLHDDYEWQTILSPTAWRIGIILSGSYSANTEFEQFTTLWGSDSLENIYDFECYVTDEDNPIACASQTLVSTLFVFSTSTSVLLDLNYTNVKVGDIHGNALNPSSYYDVYDFRSETGTFYKTYTFVGIDDSASSTIVIDACTGNTDQETTSDTACTKIYFGNGYSTTTYEQLLYSSGIIKNNDVVSVWDEYGCNDVGITDVKLGLQCAFLWAFAPSNESIARFSVLKNNMLTLYPIGYATIAISDFTEALSTTTTDYFDHDIPIGELFGREGGTTTIDFDDLLQYKDMGDPIYDWVEFIMWFGFIIWLIMWGTTREL